MGKTGVGIMQLSLIILALAGGWFGFSYINQISTQASGGFWWIIRIIFVTIAAVVIGFLLNIILHRELVLYHQKTKK